MGSFISSVTSFIGYGVLDILIVIASVAAGALLLAGLLSVLQDLALKGKPDYNQEGTAAMLVGIIFGGIISFVLSIYFLATSTAGAAFMSMLGVCGILVALIVAALILGKVLQNRRYKAAEATSEPRRHRPF